MDVNILKLYQLYANKPKSSDCD